MLKRLHDSKPWRLFHLHEQSHDQEFGAETGKERNGITSQVYLVVASKLLNISYDGPYAARRSKHTEFTTHFEDDAEPPLARCPYEASKAESAQI